MFFINEGGLGINSLFLPTDIGVDSWWDADDPLGNGGRILPSNNQSLAIVKDIGLNGNDFTQNTNANRPIYIRSINNGNGPNVFRFNGNSQFMTCPASAKNNYNGPLTIIAITAAATNNQSGCILAKEDYDNFGISGGKIAYAAFKHFNRSFFKYGFNDFTDSIDWTQNQLQVNTYVLKNSSSSQLSVDFYKNAILTSSQNNSVSINTMSEGGPLYFGMSIINADYWETIFEPFSFWEGDIQALFLFFRALNNWELDLMHRYCLARIGL